MVKLYYKFSVQYTKIQIMKKYITLFAFVLMGLACNKSEDIVIEEIAFNDAIALNESTTALSENVLTQTTIATQSMETERTRWTKEQIRTFIKSWMDLPKDEKRQKFQNLTKMEKKILFHFLSNHKNKKRG